MDVKYQVFVSSTFVDLVEERRSVIESILNLGHIPVGMEAFQASDDTQWDYIKRRIDESDYYVVIVGERYGSEEKGKSYTQMEYEYAVAHGVPVAAFLLDPAARKSWPSDKVEFEKKDKVEKFRKLCQKKLIKFWKNADELGARVALALNELMRQKPRTGWVRADTVPSSSVLEELSRLSEEKRVLQSKIEELSLDERVRIPPEAIWLINDLTKKCLADYCAARGLSTTVDQSLMHFLWDHIRSFSTGFSTWTATYNVAEILSGSKDSDAAYAEVAEDIFSEFMMANIVERHIEQTYSFDKPRTYTQYRLTDYGKQFIIFAREYERRRDEKAA